MQQRLREAEEAEQKGETPRLLDGAQRVLRPTPEASSLDRKAQVRAIGLVDPAYRAAQDGLAALAQADAFKPGVDLDKIWDTLSEAEKIRAGAIERFRLEMETTLRITARPYTVPHKLGGRLDARNLKRANDNLRSEIDAYSYLLAPDSYQLLLRFVDETHRLIDVCLRQRAIQGVDVVVLYDILRDWVQKLVYQELVSRKRGMGDHGIRRIISNIDLGDQLHAQLKRLPDYSPRERLLMRLIHVHQDLGYTAYAARVSFRGGKLHRAYGARIFNDDLNRYRSLFAHTELETARVAVATHSSEELPLMQMRVVALVRAVDHLAPFGLYRVYKHLETVPHASDYLDDLVERARNAEHERFAAAHAALGQLLVEVGMAPALRDDLLAAFRPFAVGAELVDLGAWAGQVNDLKLDLNGNGAVFAKLNPDPFALRYQLLFDAQQEQLVRLVKACEQPVEPFPQEPLLKLTRPSLGSLILTRG